MFWFLSGRRVPLNYALSVERRTEWRRFQRIDNISFFWIHFKQKSPTRKIYNCSCESQESLCKYFVVTKKIGKWHTQMGAATQRTSCFQGGIEFSLEMNIAFVFECSTHTSLEEAIPWQCSCPYCQEVTWDRTSPLASPPEVGSPGIWATQIQASQTQTPSWWLSWSAITHQPLSWCTTHRASLCKHLELEGLLSALSY